MQLITVRAKRIGQDNLGSRLDVLTVDIRNFGRVGQVSFVEAVGMLHAVGVEQCPHRAIGKEGGGGLKEGKEFVHGVFGE